MSKYRIIKLSKYNYIYQLQRQSIFGWLKIMNGLEGECRNTLSSLKSHGTTDIVIHEEEF